MDGYQPFRGTCRFQLQAVVPTVKMQETTNWQITKVTQYDYMNADQVF
jgi:hypothetical protein